MIKIVLTNDIVKRISVIDENRFKMNTINLPYRIADHLRKISKKKSSYASNKIEGNPLSEQQADEVMEQDPHRHFLKPEQEVRNYYMALQVLEERAKQEVPFSKELILEVQALVEKGASEEKIGLRGE
ncbi:MAG TPA: Fic family protein, partial [Lachnospiraceae bacterium]|nr:Fic family protein [Lachnospiraceae bacterium]